MFATYKVFHHKDAHSRPSPRVHFSMPLSGHELSTVSLMLGPWLVGACVDLLLQGVIACQFVNYFTFYRDDLWYLRTSVAVLALLHVLKSIQAFTLVWINFIRYFGDISGAIMLNYNVWWQAGTPVIDAFLGLYVQSYFCYRLWVISRKWYIVVPIATVFVFAFVAMCVGTYFISKINNPEISRWFAAHLGAVFAGDVCLSATTATFLLRSKKDVLPQTAGLISALIRLSLTTAAPAALCALFNLVFSQTNIGGGSLISTAFNMALPKVYAISMLWTLNARRSIIMMHSSRNGVSNMTSNERSGARSRPQRRLNGDVELGAIQVLTQTETTQHIDVRDMFDKTSRSTRIEVSKSEDSESMNYSK
ncbi:hypothetical protein C8F01DRAFT_500720 [Mycena amicta]|nr:hypothetical protein C8F01DRAFT_500720 [Mycena amicta]